MNGLDVHHPDTAVLLGQIDALADPTRLRILRLLERKELGVSSLCQAMRIPQSTASRHLKQLHQSGWVTRHRRGTANLYRLDLERLDDSARRLWELVRERIGAWAAVRQDEVRLRALERAPAGDTERFFAGRAQRWDELRRQAYGERFLVSAAAAAFAGADLDVADLGCGTGEVLERIAPWVGRAYGVDASEAMLERARWRLAGQERIRLERGDLGALPLDDASIDRALMILVAGYLDDPAPAFAEMRRVLRPGGWGIVVDLLAHDDEAFRREMGQKHRGFEPDAVSGRLHAVGFVRVETEILPPEEDRPGPALVVWRAHTGEAARSTSPRRRTTARARSARRTRR